MSQDLLVTVTIITYNVKIVQLSSESILQPLIIKIFSVL